MSAYIYIRDQRDYKIDNVYKIAETLSLSETQSLFSSRELESGFMIGAFSFDKQHVKSVKKQLCEYLKNYEFYFEQNGRMISGKNFYKRECLSSIEKFFEEYFSKSGTYHQLSNEELALINA